MSAMSGILFTSSIGNVRRAPPGPPSQAKNTFDGLRSLCAKPRSCMCATPLLRAQEHVQLLCEDTPQRFIVELFRNSVAECVVMQGTASTCVHDKTHEDLFVLVRRRVVQNPVAGEHVRRTGSGAELGVSFSLSDDSCHGASRLAFPLRARS